jgi:hypothetical protein
MKKEELRHIGQLFYDWHKADKVEFIYGPEAKDIQAEIKRLSQLIEYVENKKRGGHV